MFTCDMIGADVGLFLKGPERKNRAILHDGHIGLGRWEVDDSGSSGKAHRV